jgi:hypothetical protein
MRPAPETKADAVGQVDPVARAKGVRDSQEPISGDGWEQLTRTCVGAATTWKPPLERRSMTVEPRSREKPLTLIKRRYSSPPTSTDSISRLASPAEHRNHRPWARDPSIDR